MRKRRRRSPGEDEEEEAGTAAAVGAATGTPAGAAACPVSALLLPRLKCTMLPNHFIRCLKGGAGSAADEAVAVAVVAAAAVEAAIVFGHDEVGVDL